MDINSFINNFAEIFDDPIEVELKPETKFKELREWDSLTALSLMAMADTEYGQNLSAKQIQESNTLHDLFLIVAQVKNSNELRF